MSADYDVARDSDCRLLAEAEAAGRDVDAFNMAYEKLRLTGKGLVSARAAWGRLGDESHKECNRCRGVLAAWGKGVERLQVRRWRHLARVSGRLYRACISLGGTHTVHWRAMRMRRWVHLLGLDDAYTEKIKAEERTAQQRRETAARKKIEKLSAMIG